MNIFNCHTHTSFSHDGNATIEQLCSEAERCKLMGFAVTDHCDCEYSDDKEMLRNLELSCLDAEKYKEAYKGKLIISKGIEIGEAIFNPAFAEEIISKNNYDVILGSVHAVRIRDFEMPFSVIDFSKLSDEFIDRYVTQYFEDLLETARNTDYDILCHLTVVLRYVVYKYKRKVDLKKYYPVISEILKAVIERGKTLEINTAGLNDGYFMPEKDVLMTYKALGGKRVALGSDAHIPRNLAVGLTEGAGLLISSGFNELTYYENRKPVTTEIKKP